jgi:hypothetical protein
LGSAVHENPASQLTPRREQIAERLARLHERGREPPDRPDRGVTPEQAIHARIRADEEDENARRAYRRAADRHRHVAQAHREAAAQVNQRGATKAAHMHQAAAAAHEAAAVADEAAAVADWVGNRGGLGSSAGREAVGQEFAPARA